MGKFDGILILSDLDGTFRGEEGTAEAHSEVVRYFTDNGGRFGFATGRAAAYMTEQPFFDLINTPCCLFNGGLIYDFEKKHTICQTSVDFSVQDFLDAVDLNALRCKKMIAACNPKEPMVVVEQNCEDIEVLSCRPLKQVFVFEDVEDADFFADSIRALPLMNNSYISKSWSVGVEVTSANATKGHAFKAIKEYLGNIHTTVGVGNYYNDIPLLQYADIGIAVGNAPQAVKAAADIIVPACNDFGFRDVIRLLEERFG